MYTILLVTHTIIVIFLIGLVLIQRTSADGMGGLGGGGNQFMTGRATANLLTRTTAILAGLFMLTSITLAVMANHMTSGSIVETTKIEDIKAPVPVDAKKDAAKKDDIKMPPPVQPTTPAVPKPE